MIASPASFEGWTLATGESAAIGRLSAYLGLRSGEAEGFIEHTMATAIIGTDGRLVRLFPDVTWHHEEALAIVRREATRAGRVDRQPTTEEDE